MNGSFNYDYKCTYASEVKTIKSKSTGKEYKLKEYNFTSDRGNWEAIPIFADRDGNIRELTVGEIYTLKFEKYYDRSSRSEKDVVTVL